ncbi:PREDICTED: DNA (cytosine-5)-methyltransferase 3-like [Chrysochloris asiatica]|uniref:DNA (Cytosine-5)-methyltransferase 3-like n=1 Tax=Chrysochloris asiatica TaxID=185453 RepID=A0A9B0X0G0_CHRAS|nr:PREDICTED: DNA (cytosine-5)-methyltransferase 3-like [Chrysochloris asiatica]
MRAFPDLSSSTSTRTLNLESQEGLDADPADCLDPLEGLDKEKWGASCDTVMDLEEEHSTDVILVGSSELSCPPSPQSSRDHIAHEVRIKQRHIEDICICCGSFQVSTEHPLFEGGMCIPCKNKFLDSLFLYDDDGYQSYCSICCSGETLLICENPDCTRCYCFECVDTLVSPGTSERVQAMSNWVCFLCLPFASNGLLQRRKKWRTRLKAFHDQEAESSFEIFKTVPAWKREPVRVLSLFGEIQEGWFVFQFHRMLQYARPRPGSTQPFFWMFVDNLVLTSDDRAVATRFLEPVSVGAHSDAQDIYPYGKVKEWGPFDLMYGSTPPLGHAFERPTGFCTHSRGANKDSTLKAEEELSLLVQDRPRARFPTPSPAALVKNCFLPLKEYFKYFSTALTSSP